MYYSEEQIISALNIIKSICSGFSSQGECAYCPFGSEEGNCIIRFNMLAPSHWNINQKTDTVWRAFNLEEKING